METAPENGYSRKHRIRTMVKLALEGRAGIHVEYVFCSVFFFFLSFYFLFQRKKVNHDKIVEHLLKLLNTF